MIAAFALALALGQVDGGTPPAFLGAVPALRVSYELADGGVVQVPAQADGGVVAIVLTPEKAIELANERQLRDWQLTETKRQLQEARSAPHPATWVAVVGQVLSAALNAVPVIVLATKTP